MKSIISLINLKTFLDVLILSLILLLVSVMGGIGFDFALGKKLISLHSLKNVLLFALFIWTIKKIVYKEKIWLKTDLDLPVLIYLMTFVFAVIFSSQPKVSFLFFCYFFLCIIMIYFLINNIDDKKKLEAMLFILITAVIYTVGRGIFQHLKAKMGSDDGNYYSFIGRAEFGAVAVLTMPVLAAFLFNYKKKLIASFVFIIGLAALMMGIIISYSRGSWIGFIFVLLSFIFLHNKILKNWKVLLLKILVIIFLFLILPPNIKNRINSIADFTNTGGDRIPIWNGSVKMIKDFPFFGTGPGTFDVAAQQYKGSDSKEDWIRGWHAHNIFLHIASENGIIGLVSFFTIIVVSFKKYFELKNKIEDEKLKNLLDGAFVSLIGYLACSQTTIFFANHNKNEKISMFLWFDIALIFIIENIARKNEEKF